MLLRESGSPVVGELEREPGMVRRLDGDDVGAEIWSQEEAEGLDDVGSLGLPAGQRELGELLIGLQHDQVGTKHHTGRLLLVVIDLNCRVVGDTECDDPRLVPLHTGPSPSCGGRDVSRVK